MIWNYLLFILKLCVCSAILAIPVILLVFLFKNFFKKLNNKKNFVFSLFIISYIVTLIIILLMYFIPIIRFGFETELIGFWSKFGNVLLHILRLAIVNLLITGIVVTFGFLASAIYDKLSRNKKQKTINLKNLWISLCIVNIIVIIIILLFPTLISIILNLIYL